MYIFIFSYEFQCFHQSFIEFKAANNFLWLKSEINAPQIMNKNALTVTWRHNSVTSG